MQIQDPHFREPILDNFPTYQKYLKIIWNVIEKIIENNWKIIHSFLDLLFFTSRYQNHYVF